MTDAQIASARRKLEGKVVKTLSASEARSLAVQLFHKRETGRLSAAVGGPDKLSKYEADNDLADWLDALKDLEDDEARNVIDHSVRTLLKSHGVELDKSSPDCRNLHPLIRRVYIEGARRETSERQQDFSSVTGDALFKSVDGKLPLSPIVAPVTLSAVISRFRREPDQLALSPKSTGPNPARDKLFKEFFGADKPIAAISRQDVAGFVELQLRLQPNFTKRWRGLTGAQAAEKASKDGVAFHRR